MTEEKFHRELKKHLGNMQIELRVNENKTTMLNLLAKRSNCVRLSVHRMFLDAPEPVISAIAHYIRGGRKQKQQRNAVLRSYIHSHLPRLDYGARSNQASVHKKGRVYDLGAIFREINQDYFDNKLQLQITWFGSCEKKNRVRVTFGLYYDALKLIKIHRILDNAFFPRHFVSFVVYHEALHAVVPGYMDERGRYRVHGPEFKEKEKKFALYDKSIAWEKKHREHFFKLYPFTLRKKMTRRG